ncbi:MAG: membrane dipeptidase [Candidatus Handelsmanbacteria bacterium]|nr:membrane dipeptidase [Candidatus Handelsmanbacteria bacterium]
MTADQFHRSHPICDLLGINLTHPRFLLDHIDLGQRQHTTCRGDFVKLKEWGLSVVMCKGGPAQYDGNFAGLWKSQPEWREGRPDPEPMFLSGSIKSPTQLVLAVLDRFLGDVEAHPDKVLLVHRAADLDRARAQDKLALLMGANRSDWFGDSPGVLRMFARLGLRMITLGQSGRELGYDASDEVRSGGRMTTLGLRMIREMNRAGILIDLAHTNEVCALDIIENSASPVIDSHSNPQVLEPSPRNTSDAVMKALAARGGLLGIMPPISRPAGEQPYQGVPADQLARTIGYLRYAVDLMGVEGVGIGTHFNSAVFPYLTEGLLDAGFSEADAALILGGNYLRLLRQVLPA